MKSFPKVIRFQQNKRGRDYVVGDLHGAYSLLFEAMQAVGFTPGIDRIFSVGDLIDRGPDSANVCEILRIPGFHAIMGNHEHMLLELVDSFGIDANILLPHHKHNGLAWWLDTPIEQRELIIHAIRQLPYAMQVSTSRGECGFVHADIPSEMDWPTFINAIESGDGEIMHHCLWQRDRYETGNYFGVAGIGRVYVGHTPMKNGVELLGNIFYIDTGAVFATYGHGPGAGLTMAQLAVATGSLKGSIPLPTLLNVLDPNVTPDYQFSSPASNYAAAPL